MQLVPQSWGSPLREFNPCHDPKDGKFATRTAGRCAPENAGFHNKVRKKFDDDVRYRAALRTTATSRLADRKAMAGLPRHLRLDAARSLRDERTVVRYLDAPEGRSTAYQAKRAIVVRRYPAKQTTLAALRHEIGHITPDALGRGGAIVSGVELSPKNKAQRTYIEEVRAWKNAIVAARGRVNIQRDAAGPLRSYWGPVAKSLLPKAPSLKKMTADAFVAAGQPAPEMRGVGYQGWGGQTPGAAYVLGKNPAVHRAVLRQKREIAHQRKVRAAELSDRFDRQMASLERFARVVRRAAAVERRARRKAA